MEHKHDVYPKDFARQLSFYSEAVSKPVSPLLDERDADRELFKGLAAHNQYRGKRGDLTDVKCVNCEYQEARIEMAYGSKMRIRCIRCKHAEIVERPLALK